MNLNKVIITGNVTAAPELRYTPNEKAIVSASLANNEHYTDARGEEQQQTTFVNLEIWGKAAENFGKLVKKGQELVVEGKLRMTEWTDKQTNARRTRLYILVESWQFTQYKRQDEAKAGPSVAKPAARTVPAPATSTRGTVPADLDVEPDDIPF